MEGFIPILKFNLIVGYILNKHNIILKKIYISKITSKHAFNIKKCYN